MLSGLLGYSQTIDDALRYSQINLGGTARYTSMGGAFGAFGGDISSISDNPAATGVFVYSELNMSPTFYHNNTSAEYLGSSFDDNAFRFNLNNFGYVGTMKLTKNSWKTLNFAFSHKKLDNYNQYLYIEAQNNQNSITDYFAEQAYNTSLSSLDDGTGGSDLVYNAYNTYLINPISNNPDEIEYKSAYSNYGETQIHSIKNTGARNDYGFSMGANYDNKLYLGMSINYIKVKYSYSSNFQEHDYNKNIDNFNYMQFTDDYITKGYGYALKMGLIYRPLKWLRVGTSFQSPINYYLEDSYNHTLESYVTVDGVSGTQRMESPLGVFNYNIISPLKLMGALGFVIGKHAVIGLEYKYLDYSFSSIKSNQSGDEFSIENKAIKDIFQSANNLKAGFEYRLGKISLRTGITYLGSPYQNEQINKNAYTIYYSGGLGFNFDFFYLDFAYSHGYSNYYYYPYQLSNSYNNTPYQINESTNKYITTIGLRF